MVDTYAGPQPGYGGGYRPGPPAPGYGGGYRPGPVMNGRAYRMGFAAGQRDKRMHVRYDSARGWNSVPPGEHVEYNRGYAAGWASIR